MLASLAARTFRQQLHRHSSSSGGAWAAAGEPRRRSTATAAGGLRAAMVAAAEGSPPQAEKRRVREDVKRALRQLSQEQMAEESEFLASPCPLPTAYLKPAEGRQHPPAPQPPCCFFSLLQALRIAPVPLRRRRADRASRAGQPRLPPSAPRCHLCALCQATGGGHQRSAARSHGRRQAVGGLVGGRVAVGGDACTWRQSRCAVIASQPAHSTIGLHCPAPTCIPSSCSLYVPRVQDKDANMHFLHLDSLAALTAVPPFGIREPRPTYDDGGEREDVLLVGAAAARAGCQGLMAGGFWQAGWGVRLRLFCAGQQSGRQA